MAKLRKPISLQSKNPKRSRFFLQMAFLRRCHFEVISNLHVQESKFGGKIYKFGGKSKKKLKLREFMEFVFFQVYMAGI